MQSMDIQCRAGNGARATRFGVVVLLTILTAAFSSPRTGSCQLIIAHRGASFDAPENTLAAFRLAFEQRADGIEADFYLSRDHQIVCIHDPDTERVAGKKFVVSQTSLAELRKLDVGSWKNKRWAGERIPTIQEVFATVPKGKKIFIELKTGPEIVKPLVAAIKKSSLAPDQFEIICFNIDTILECEKLIDGVVTHWLAGYKETPPDGGELGWTPTIADVVRTLRAGRCDSFGSQADRNVFDAGFIDSLRALGVHQFHVWTVDDIPTARFYQEKGAYGITTNRPALIRDGLIWKTKSPD